MSVLAVAVLALFVQNSSIQGTVFRSTNSPLSKATVELRSDDNDSRLIDSARTEDDGKFAFQNVRPGPYRLAVTHAGYFRPPMLVRVAAGEPVKDVQLSMSPTGAIAGRIFDSNGEPLGNADVQALRASYARGIRSLMPVQSVQTNDLGEYRLFWLPPGRYYVMAQPQPLTRRVMSHVVNALDQRSPGHGVVFPSHSGA